VRDLDSENVALAVEGVRLYAEDREKLALALRTCDVCGRVSRTGATAERHWERHSKRDKELADLLVRPPRLSVRDPRYWVYPQRDAKHLDEVLTEAAMFMSQGQRMQVRWDMARVARAMEDAESYMNEAQVQEARKSMDGIIGRLLYG
jgi:hypothetical protein